MLIASCLFTVLCQTPRWAEPQIVLRPEMLVNETGFADANALVDEQDATVAKPPTKPFFGGWTSWQYPMNVAIDLGSECQVGLIRIYNESGGGSIGLSTGQPFGWKLSKVELTGYQRWNEFPVNRKTRWLRLSVNGPTYVSELLVFGKRVGAVKARPVQPLGRIRPTVDQLMGVNAFIDDPVDKIVAPAGLVREYHPWGWDVEASDGKVRFQPSGAAGGNSWFFDDYYGKLSAAGVTVCPVIWQAALPAFAAKSKEAKPIAPGADPEDPKSYLLHAKHFFQYAARYGSVKVPDKLLDLAAGQPRRSGLGSLRYLEIWNEPDKTWEGREGRFNPFELAAMASADLDGDQGRMGSGIGVRAADPKMKLVLGGLAGLDLEYLRAMKMWADSRRGGNFPADVLNLHHYSSSSNEQWFQAGGHGISPEEDDLRGKLARIVRWRDLNLPKCEVWLTEYGYDTNAGSPLHVPVIGSMGAEKVQAAWLVRSVLALAAAGVDRSAQFMLRDVDSKGAGVFSTCGLVTEKGAWVPKASWHSLVALKKSLKGFRFDAEVASGNKDVLVFRFRSDVGRIAFVVWCKTSTDLHVSGFGLKVAAKSATLVDLGGGTSKALPVVGGVARFEVTEMPQVVLVG